MASTSDFRNGLCLEFNNGLYIIVQFQHVKPGKGPAFVRTKLKSLTTGKVIENTFSAGVKVNTARVERRPYQFLYTDDLGLNFMHLETFEQIPIQAEMIENADLMKEGQAVEIVVHADTETPLSVDLPPFVELQITGQLDAGHQLRRIPRLQGGAAPHRDGQRLAGGHGPVEIVKMGAPIDEAHIDRSRL